MTNVPEQLTVALKEWDVVCRALGAGDQVILLRKGGIHESGGEFEIEHRAFALFPTFLHQNAGMLKPAAAIGLQAHSAEPAKIMVSSAAVVTDIIEVASREQVDSLEAEHVWSPALIDMRFNYRPSNPLYVLVVRAYKLPTPITLDNTPAYAGCKSWVPLAAGLDAGGAIVVVGDSEFARKRERILAAFV